MYFGSLMEINFGDTGVMYLALDVPEVYAQFF
jgi:hypothetical protein